MKCQTCEYSLFDEKWGEFKCTLHSRRVTPIECEQCPDSEKKSKKD